MKPFAAAARSGRAGRRPSLRRRAGAGGLLALLGVLSMLRADTAIPVGTDLASGVTLRLATPLTSLPRFGFLPLRVNVENSSERDGQWRLRFRAGTPGAFPGELTSDFEVAVPARQTRAQWIYVPLAEPGTTFAPVPIYTSPVTVGTVGPRGPIVMPSLPASLPGLLPPPAGVTQTIEPLALRNQPSGGLARTYVIKQVGPATALPEMTAAELPARATQTRRVDERTGEVTRTTSVQVETAPPTVSRTSTSPYTAGTNLRDRLDQSGLLVKQAGVSTSTSMRMETNPKTAVREMVTTVAQTGPAAALPAVNLTQVPAGVSVEFGPGAHSGEVTRSFVVREPMPTAAKSGPTFAVGSLGAPSGGTGVSSGTISFSGVAPSLSAVEAEARAKLAGTGLLSLGAGVKETRIILAGPTINRAGTTSAPLSGILFIQTGAPGLLRRPAGALPPGTVVALHPAASAGEVVRTVSYVDPAAHAAWLGQVPTGYPPSLYVQMQGRFELQRYGYFRPDGAIQQSQSTRAATPGSSQASAMVFSETGPAALLTIPESRDLPPGTTVTVTPGALPGETQRNFIVTGSPAGGVVSAAAPAARGSSPIVRTRTAMYPPLSVALTVTGPGLSRPAELALGYQLASGSTVTPPLAVALALETTLRSKLATAGVRGAPSLAPVDGGQLPADWRVWSSFHSVLLPQVEYEELDAARRGALLRWVALGGRVLLVPAFAGEAETTWLGAGRIDRLATTLDDVTPAALVTALRFDDLPLSLPDASALAFPAKSPLGAILNGVDEPNTWLAMFLVLFAVVIGPVNLYFLAPVGKRHRLFLTTPLLALLGAAGLVATIVLRDGFGGDGARRTLVVLLPGDPVAAVFQEDASRTGFLTSSRFPLASEVLAVPLRGRSASGPGALRTPTDSGLARLGDWANGGWFRNRGRQAHHLRTLLPTRMRVEITATEGRPPIAESTLGTTLRDFVYADVAGKLWSAAELPPGRRVALTPAERWPVVVMGGTLCLEGAVKSALTRAPGRWVARGGPSEVAPVALMPGLRWDDDIRYSGMVIPAGLVEKGSGQ